MMDLSDHTDFPYKLLISLLIRGIHMGEIFKLDDLGLILSNGTQQSRCLSPEDANKSSFRNVILFGIPDGGRSLKTK
jgi:hypothetical protein